MAAMNIICRWAADLCYRAAGADVFGKLALLKQAETWSDEQLNLWRLTKLNKILQFAWTHVPFYRRYWGDHRIDFKTVESLEELEGYPVITKATIKEHADQMIPDNLLAIRHIRKSTGGTSGVPLQYYMDKERWALLRAYQIWGMGLAGYSFGDPLAIVAGGSLLPNRSDVMAMVRNAVERRSCALGVHMDTETARSIYRMLIRRKIRFIYGYPSILSLLALEFEKLGLTIDGITSVITTAEMLQPVYRATIERVFRCKVYDDLGCGDGGYLGFECHLHHGYHYNALESILNVRDPDAQGIGPVVITNLWNRATPFIRYENGDLLSLGSTHCGCGRGFPIIREIRGRTGDILRFANGRSVAAPALTLVFSEMPIDAWQVVQTTDNAVEVRLLSRTEISEKHKKRIESVLRYHLGDEVTFTINRVQKLETTAGGKLKPVFRSLGHQGTGDRVRGSMRPGVD
jgi:phenylacetate-CoA ligase